MGGGIDLGDLRFRPHVVGIVELWKDFLCNDETLSFPGAGPRRWPERQLSQRRWPHEAQLISSH